MLITNVERINRLERAYEHLATKADIADFRGEGCAGLQSLENGFIRWKLGSVGIGLSATILSLKSGD